MGLLPAGSALRAATFTVAVPTGCIPLGIAFLLAGCGGSGGAGLVDDELPTGAPAIYFQDFHAGGLASGVRWSSVRFGRLVEVQGLNAAGVTVPMANDFVISQNLISDQLNYNVSVDGVTGLETLLILRNVDDPAQRAEFLELMESAGESLDPIQVQDLGTTGIFSMLPRNAAVVLTFDDLLSPATISDRTIQLVHGVPPASPFEARVFPSKHYGGIASNGSFYSTRVIIDMTTSLVEKQRTGVGSPLNGVGLPASLDPDRANVQLRIPTVANPSIGQTRVLTNLSNHELQTTNNGPVDFSTNALAVTRAMRSGGRAGVIVDPFNGFLRDTNPPQIIGSTPLVVVVAPVQQQGPAGDPGALEFVLPEVYLPSELCGYGELSSSDVITQSGLFARVVKPLDLTPSQAAAYTPDENGKVFNLPVRLVSFPREWVGGPSDWEIFGATESRLESPFQVGDVPDCFVQVLPRPSGYPDQPTTGAEPSAIFSLRFSEPMDPASLTAFDSVTVTRRMASSAVSLVTSDYVVGELIQSATLREATFVPVLDLAHRQGTAEEYFFNVSGDGDRFVPSDLAGNALLSIPTVAISIAREAVDRLNGGRVSRFASTDEELPAGPEWGGQIQIQADRQALRGRPVIRQQVVIDNEEQALPAQMTAFPMGVITPFSPLGSKMQTVWRYADCGFSLTDASQINIDIEELSWAPAGGSVVPDDFDRFEILLAHARVAPDETINPMNLFPRFERSGLKPVFAQNVASGETQQVVHPRERGYSIQPGDLYVSSRGTTLIPFPLNRGIPEEDKRYFTWRDTRLRTRGGPLGNGVEPLSYPPALGLEVAPNPYFARDHVQSVGLPLLMEFRNSLQLSASGRNAWVLNLAINSSSKPYFRAYSTGGVNTAGNQVFIDPDNEIAANGGFNPGSVPPGAATFGRDNSVHLGAIDYVTRISQAHSIWFEAVIDSEGAGAFGGRVYSEPTVEPAMEDQPDGTRVEFFYRGATAIQFADGGIDGAMDNFSGAGALELADYQYDALKLDLFGDYYNDVDASTATHSADHTDGGGRDNYGLAFLPSADPEAWHASVNEISGSRYYQVRVTFTGNPVTGQGAELSAFALTWTQP